jgi:hypothetical protein
MIKATFSITITDTQGHSFEFTRKFEIPETPRVGEYLNPEYLSIPNTVWEDLLEVGSVMHNRPSEVFISLGHLSLQGWDDMENSKEAEKWFKKV